MAPVASPIQESALKIYQGLEEKYQGSTSSLPLPVRQLLNYNGPIAEKVLFFLTSKRFEFHVLQIFLSNPIGVLKLILEGQPEH
jgi:hypothetical protein